MAPGMARSLVGRRGRPGGAGAGSLGVRGADRRRGGALARGERPGLRLPRPGLPRDLRLPLEGLQGAHPADTRWLRRHRVPPRRPVGGQAQHDQLRRWTPFPRGAVDPRPEGPRRLRRLLVPQGGRAPAVQLLGGRLDPRPLPRLGRPDLADRAVARPGRQLRGVGERPPRPGRPVLADRRSRRHGVFDRRERVSAVDQRLYVRRRHGDRRDRGPGRRAQAGRVVPPQGGGGTARRRGAALGRRGAVLQDGPAGRADRAGQRARGDRLHPLVLRPAAPGARSPGRN